MERVHLFFEATFYEKINSDGVIYRSRGHVFKENKIYVDQDLADFCAHNIKPNNIEEFINSIDGHFAIIIQMPDKIILIVDRSRSIPLFYSTYSSAIFVSDKAEKINTEINGIIDTYAISEIKLIGCCTSEKTIIKEIKQVKTANYVQLKLNIEMILIESFEYFNYRKKILSHSDYSDSELLIELDNILITTFQKLIKFANTRKIVVPLSGGLDSRLIVYFLHRLQYKNVLCFTYGLPNNWEAKISQETASRAGFEWTIIPYSRRMWNEFIHSQEAFNFYRFGSDLNSLALFQDFLAVKKLKDLIPSDSIFVPGLSMDFLAGSQIPPNLFEYKEFSEEKLVHDIINKYCSTVSNGDVNSNISSLISDDIIRNIKKVTNPEDYSSEFENWFFQEKLVKYVVNSVRAYEYFDFQWSLPFYYKDLLIFWKNINLEHKFQKRLFLKYLEGRFLFENVKCPDRFIKKTQRINNSTLFILRKIVHEFRNIKKIFLDYYTHPMQWYGVFDSYKDYLIFSIKNYNRRTSLSLRYIAFIVKRFI